MSERHFISLAELSHFALGLSARTLVGDIQGRTVVAHDLHHHVRERIGKPDLLPPPLKESTVRDRVEKGFSPNETLLRTGELQRSIGWEHSGARTTIVGSRDPKSVYHELGTAKVPKRSFLAATASERNAILYEKYLAALGAMVIEGKQTTFRLTEAESL